ncbi:MAG: nucleoside hydrolase [Xanthobacteraceae bacterium]
MTQYHIDTDMGVDDGLALAIASQMLGASLRAVSTVFGNVPVEVATKNALIFRRLLPGPTHFPIYVGAERASDGFFRDARHVHGKDGLGGATAMLSADILRDIGEDSDLDRLDAVGTLNADQDPIVIIGLGPATNVPGLVEKYGRASVQRIVLMSGSYFDRGNITEVAEFNAHCDPGALQRTLALGIPVTIVPLDVCRKVQLSRTTVKSYLERDESLLTRLIVQSHMPYMDFYQKWEGIDGCFPHDTLAVLAAARPEWFWRTPSLVDIDLVGDARGRTSLALVPKSHVDVAFGGELKNVREWLQSWPNLVTARGRLSHKD